MEKFPNKKMPEYDPWTGDKNPFLIDIDTEIPDIEYKRKSKFTFIFWASLICAFTAVLNTLLTIAIGMHHDIIFAWTFGSFFSINCVVYEFMRCNRR